MSDREIIVFIFHCSYYQERSILLSTGINMVHSSCLKETLRTADNV